MTWQIATASASAAWSGAGLRGERRAAPDHARDLVLVGAPVAADGGLDLLGRVAGARHAALPGGQHHHAAGVADREGGAHVLAEVELLQGDRVGLMLGQQRSIARVDVGQAALLGTPARVSITPPSSAVRRPPLARHDAVAGAGQAGVYAEHDHR